MFEMQPNTTASMPPLSQPSSGESPSSPVFNWIMGDNDEFLASLADTFEAAGSTNPDSYHLDSQAAPSHAISNLPGYSGTQGADATQDVGLSPSNIWSNIDPHLWSDAWSGPVFSSPSTPFLDSLTSPTTTETPVFPPATNPTASNVQPGVPRRGLPRRKSRLNLSGASSLRESSVEGASSVRTGRSRLRRPTSTSSLNSVDTATSVQSVDSNASNRSRYNLSRSSSRRQSRNRGAARPSQAANKDRRAFCCTFCCDTFKSKYDWSRHEKSLHLSLERWVCTPYGGAVVSIATGRSQCAYCNILDPTPEHLDSHCHQDCQQGNQPPVFSRKDHLVQHLRHVHHMKVLPVIDDWKIDAPPVTSRCGFCDARLSTWQDRVEHLGTHFKQGKTMQDWLGEHEFEPNIAAQVVNALPPYIIGSESKSPVPFSATDSGTKQHLDQVQQAHRERILREQAAAAALGPSTATELDEKSQPKVSDRETIVQILTRGLGRFARHQMSRGIVPTDEMFQNESRRLVYGSDDPWNQTIADNAEWLRDFRARNVESDNKSHDV